VAGNRFLMNGYCVLRDIGLRLLAVMLLLRVAPWKESEAGRQHPRNFTFSQRFDLGLFRHEAGAVICGFTRKY
jgi:hypothetical protein